MSNSEDGAALLYQKNEEQDDHNDIWDDTALIEAYDKAVGLMKEEIASRNQHTPKAAAKILGQNDHSSVRRKKHNRKNKSKTKKWKVGSKCEATYSEDNMPYVAVIKSINAKEGTCVVEYLGYGNKEEHSLRDIRSVRKHRERLRTHDSDSTVQTSEASEGQANDAGDESEDDHCFSTAHSDSEKPCSHHFPPPPMMSGMWPFGAPPPFPPSWPPFSRSCSFAQPPCGAYRPPPMSMPPPPTLPPLQFDSADDALAATLMAWYISGYHTGYYQAMRRHGKSSSHHTAKK